MQAYRLEAASRSNMKIRLCHRLAKYSLTH